MENASRRREEGCQTFVHQRTGAAESVREPTPVKGLFPSALATGLCAQYSRYVCRLERKMRRAYIQDVTITERYAHA